MGNNPSEMKFISISNSRLLGGSQEVGSVEYGDFSAVFLNDYFESFSMNI